MSTITPAGERLTDVSIMPTIHSALRREFRLAPELVGAVADRDRRRVEVVAGHLDLIGRELHKHHTLEDRFLWPVLLERVSEQLAPVVELMAAQHAVVDDLLGHLGDAVSAWRRTASAADRDLVADLLAQLHPRLVEHLDAEEAQLLPIAARTVTQDEWDRMGVVARAETPKGEEMLTLGMIAHDGDPVAVARMLATAPPPVRFVLLRAARRAYRRHALRVHGTARP